MFTRGIRLGYYEDLLNILVLTVTEELGDSGFTFSSLHITDRGGQSRTSGNAE